MTDRVFGNAKAGEFITANISYYSVATIVPVAQTNVTVPVADLYIPASGWVSISVIDGNGVTQTYASQSSYQDAFNKQANLNLLMQLFEMRASLVAMSVTSATVANPSTATYTGYSYATSFGSAYSSSATVYTVKFATDRLAPWLVQAVTSTDNTNAGGFQFLDFIQGTTVVDLASSVLQTTVFETKSATNTNTLAYLTNTL